MDVRVGSLRRLSDEELMPLNCGAGENSCKDLGLQGDQISQSQRKSTWIYPGKTDAEAKAPILRPPDTKSQLTGKDPDAVKDWGQEKKGVTEDKVVGWHHWGSGHEFEQTPGDSEGQGSLVLCSPCSCKESDMTWQLNNRWLICYRKVKKVKVTQLCPTFCDSMDCSPLGSSIHGIFQGRIPEWVAIPFSKWTFLPRDQTQVSCTAGEFLTIWATRKAL